MTNRQTQEIFLVLVDATSTRNSSQWQEYLNENFERVRHAAATLIAARKAAMWERGDKVFGHGQCAGEILHHRISLLRFARERLRALGTATRFVSGKIITTFLTAARRVASGTQDQKGDARCG